MSNNRIMNDDYLNDILEESLRSFLNTNSNESSTNRAAPSSSSSHTFSLPLSSIVESVVREIPNMLNEISFNNIVYMDESGNALENLENERTNSTEQDIIEENRQDIENNIIDLIRSDDHNSSEESERNIPVNTNNHRNTNTTTFNISAPSNNHTNQNSNSNSNPRQLEILDDFIASWFRHTRDYNEQMRLYHQNILQMIRVSQSITRILQGAVRTSYPEPRHNNINNTQNIPVPSLIPPNITDILTRNGLNLNMDIQGFSIPINRVSEPNIHPTIRQIFEATERYNYNSERMRDIIATRCPISLEDFQLGDELCEIKHCHHIFKWRSLQSWFSRNSHCPVCRYDIRDYTSSTSL